MRHISREQWLSWLLWQASNHCPSQTPVFPRTFHSQEIWESHIVQRLPGSSLFARPLGWVDLVCMHTARILTIVGSLETRKLGLLLKDFCQANRLKTWKCIIAVNDGPYFYSDLWRISQKVEKIEMILFDMMSLCALRDNPNWKPRTPSN